MISVKAIEVRHYHPCYVHDVYRVAINNLRFFKGTVNLEPAYLIPMFVEQVDR
jgi:hypothetical protein